MTNLPARAGWLTVLSLAAVAAVNLAGVWQIAAARRVAAEEAGRVFSAETAAPARAMDGRLSAPRADLGFLAASEPIARLDPAAPPRPRGGGWRRAGGGGRAPPRAVGAGGGARPPPPPPRGGGPAGGGGRLSAGGGGGHAARPPPGPRLSRRERRGHRGRSGGGRGLVRALAL